MATPAIDATGGYLKAYDLTKLPKSLDLEQPTHQPWLDVASSVTLPSAEAARARAEKVEKAFNEVYGSESVFMEKYGAETPAPYSILSKKKRDSVMRLPEPLPLLYSREFEPELKEIGDAIESTMLIGNGVYCGVVAESLDEWDGSEKQMALIKAGMTATDFISRIRSHHRSFGYPQPASEANKMYVFDSEIVNGMTLEKLLRDFLTTLGCVRFTKYTFRRMEDKTIAAGERILGLEANRSPVKEFFMLPSSDVTEVMEFVRKAFIPYVYHTYKANAKTPMFNNLVYLGVSPIKMYALKSWHVPVFEKAHKMQNLNLIANTAFATSDIYAVLIGKSKEVKPLLSEITRLAACEAVLPLYLAATGIDPNSALGYILKILGEDSAMRNEFVDYIRKRRANPDFMKWLITKIDNKNRNNRYQVAVDTIVTDAAISLRRRAMAPSAFPVADRLISQKRSGFVAGAENLIP